MAEKILHSYETIFIIDAGLDEEATKGAVEKFTNLIAANGTVDAVDEWGKRRLAYEIDDKTEGYYVLVNFTSDADFPKELDRQYRITDSILRTIIIRKDEK
jgi:small subunit ribosomal protein S6